MKPLLRWSEQQQYDENNGDRPCGARFCSYCLLACLFASAQTTALLSFVTRTECESCRNYVAVAVRAAAVGGVARLMMMMTQLVQHLHTLVVVHYDD